MSETDDHPAAAAVTGGAAASTMQQPHTQRPTPRALPLPQKHLRRGECLWELVHPKDKDGLTPVRSRSGRYRVKLFLLVSLRRCRSTGAAWQLPAAQQQHGPLTCACCFGCPAPPAGHVACCDG